MKKFGVILIAFILFFCACRKNECRKKEDSVSGDAIELVYIVDNKHWDFFAEISETLFVKNKNIKFDSFSFVILDELELANVNEVLKNFLNIELNTIDFSSQSYCIILFSDLEKETFLNVNIKVNQSDSVSVLIDYIEYPAKINLPTPFLGHANNYKIFFIKTNKINYRAYEKHNSYSVCN